MLFILLRTFISALRSHRALALENLALRHQLEVLERNTKKPRSKIRDRVLWVLLSRFWNDWRMPLIMVQPDTVIQWYRKGFRYYWRWKSRPRWPGRQRVPKEVRDLIRRMSRNNPLWGAPPELAYISNESRQGYRLRGFLHRSDGAIYIWIRTFVIRGRQRCLFP